LRRKERKEKKEKKRKRCGPAKPRPRPLRLLLKILAAYTLNGLLALRDQGASSGVGHF
jgi:hypothetical protein